MKILKGFRVYRITDISTKEIEGFERWENDKSLVIILNNAKTLSIDIGQMYLAQNFKGYNVAKGYCQNSTAAKSLTFEEIQKEVKKTFGERIKSIFE